MGVRKLPVAKTNDSAGASAGSTQANKLVPSAADLGEVFTGANYKAKSEAISQKADIILSVLKYNEEASLYVPMFSEGAMNVIHCLHNQKPSMESTL